MSGGWNGYAAMADEDDLLADQEADWAGYNVDTDTPWMNKDSVILAIDCSASMFQTNEEFGEIPFKCALKCASSLLQDKIISSDADLIGILFFGTKKNGNTIPSFKGVYIFQDLDNPDAKRILEIEALLDKNFNFQEEFGHDKYSVSDVLWACSMMFSKNSKTGTKRIFLFTNEDDPHHGDHTSQISAKTKAKDLFDLGIEIELFNLRKKSGEAFSYDKFYSDVIIMDEDEEPGDLPDVSKKLTELLERVRRKEFKKRTLVRLPFNLSADMQISVRVYNLVLECKKSYPINLEAQSNKPVRVVTKYVTEEGDTVSAKDLKYFYTYGGQKTIFEVDEINMLKNFGKSGITLLGFKPIEKIKTKYSVRHSSFLYPNEQGAQGSSLVFNSLIIKMSEMKKAAICIMIIKVNSPPRLVALIPQLEKFDEGGFALNPPGFQVIPLAFSDDLRHLSFDEMDKANERQIDAAKKVIQKLELKNFSSCDYENPTLQKHYCNLQTLALNRDQPEEIVDYTLPSLEKMRRRCENEAEEWNHVVYPEGFRPEKEITSAPTKRSADQMEGEEPKKKIKISTQDLKIEDIDKMALNGELGGFTIPVLKEMCQMLSLKVSGKKQDLVDRIEEHFGK